MGMTKGLCVTRDEGKNYCVTREEQLKDIHDSSIYEKKPLWITPPLPLATLSHPDVNQLLKRKQLTNNLSVHFLRQILLKCVSFWLRMLRYFFVFVNSIFWFYEILFARRLPLQHTISIARAQINILCPKVM